MDRVSIWRLKIERAKEHCAALDAEVVAWVATKPITMTKEKDPDGRRHALVAEIVTPPLLDRWALMSGDCVHNLRSALDSLLYGIAIHETGLNPPKDEARLQFPITSSPEEFEVQKKRRLCSLSAAVQSEIEKAQPYKNPHQEFPPVLELLGSLNNFDKHRTLHVVAAVPHAASISDIVSTGDATITVSVYRTIITGRTEILSFTIEPPNPDLAYKYEAQITICIAHSPGPSKSAFSQLAAVLASLIEDVERIVSILEGVVGQMQNPVNVNLSQLSFQGSRGLLQRCHGVLQCSHRFSRFHVGFLPLINRRLGRLTWKFCTRGSSSGRPRGTAEDQSDCAAPIHSCLNLDVSRARLNSEPGRSQLAKRRPHCQVAFNGAFNGGRPVPRSVVFLELSEACTAPPTNSPPTRGLQIAITLPGLSCHSFSGDKPGFFGTIFVSNRMECGEKSRLIEEHSRVALAYSRAARALRGKRGTRSAEGQQALDEARIKSQDARAAVKRHIPEHGC